MPRHEIKTFQYPESHVRAGMWGYSVDGRDAGMGFPEEWAAQRSANRLLQGRTNEVQLYGRVDVEKADGTDAQGNPTTLWYYTLDGVRADTPSDNPTEAKTDGAIEAFLTRYTSRFPEIQERFTQETGETSSEIQEDANGRTVIRSESGNEYAVAYRILDDMEESGRPKFAASFKQIVREGDSLQQSQSGVATPSSVQAT